MVIRLVAPVNIENLRGWEKRTGVAVAAATVGDDAGGGAA